jgi:hypothetical protein
MTFKLCTLAVALLSSGVTFAAEDAWQQARANGRIVNDVLIRADRNMKAWLAYADPKTKLLPDRLPGMIRGRMNSELLYTPHNSGADNYPFLILTAHFTDPDLYKGRMVEMLRSEVQYTDAPGGKIPANLDLKTNTLGPPSFFGAGEYCKDGMVPVTEFFGRDRWFYRMVDMTEDFMLRAPFKSRWGNLPSDGAELNGDVLQTLARLIPMTGDRRFLHWAEQIGDAYIEEVLPRSNYLPTAKYDFDKRVPSEVAWLGDHGNETIVGLVLLGAIETEMGLPRSESYRPVLRKVLDRVIETANPYGFIYRGIRVSDLKITNNHLTDCWGYVYASIYAYYQATGEEKYRQAVLNVLKNLRRYRDYDWTKPSNTVDDLADSIEGAIYLVAHEPVPEAIAWIDHSIPKMFPYQSAEGTVERWYGDGNWNRTLLLYALLKSQGSYLKGWKPGVELGAVRDGTTLRLTVSSPADWSGQVVFDYARHRRILNLRKDYARLNQWPEWYTVDENTLYTIRNAGTGADSLRLGSELIHGYPLRVPAGTTCRIEVSPKR